jgi:hypothetical protein
MTTAQRGHARAVMDYMQGKRSQLDYPPGDQRTGRDAYSFGLSETGMHSLLGKGGRAQFDCSEYCPWVLKCAGAWRFGSPGATSVHLAWWAARRWKVYADAKLAGVAALVIFGGDGGHHEAIVHTPDPSGGNPLLSSHGHPGLDLIRLHDEADRQVELGYPGVRFLSVARL